MAKIIESGPHRMTLQSGSMTLILDKEAGSATMQRKLLFWSLKPIQVSLVDVVTLPSILQLTGHPAWKCATP